VFRSNKGDPMNDITAPPAPVLADVTAATPAEIDGHLARLDARRSQLLYTLAKLRETVLRRTRDKVVTAFYGKTDAELAEMIKTAEAELTDVTYLAHPLESEYQDRGGWARYYLVDGGHLHYDVSGFRCSRQPTTSHYWMTEFSGQDSADVIAQAGERVCTVCFPDAPVNPRPAAGRFMTPAEAEKAAYTEDQRRKAAAKKAAELRTPDGQPLIVGHWNDRLRTERAAWNWLMRTAESFAYNGESHRDDTADREGAELVLVVLAEARKTTVDALREELNRKTAKKLGGSQPVAKI
jgi:hypothetical protein